MRFSPQNKKILTGALIGALLLLVVPNVTHAFWSVPEIIGGAFKMIAYVVNFIFGMLFAVANYFVKIALVDLNMHVMDPTNQLVQVGWGITRDLSNLFFVLAMVIMGFATIVRWEEYGMKQLLPKFIAAAIVVNFSLTIAGIFVDFSHVLTNFFLDRIGGASGDVGTNLTGKLAAAFGPQKFFLPEEDPLPPDPDSEMGLIGEIGAAFLTSVAGLAFVIIFTIIATIVMFALAIMLILRYVWLSFFLIGSSIIWFFWVIPPLKSLYDKWWDGFLKWTFFAPAISFFLYLTLISVDKIGSATKGGDQYLSGFLATIANQGAQMFVLCFLLILGLITAEKMGIEVAGKFKGAAYAVGTGAKNIAKNRAAMLGQRFAQSKAGRGLVSGATATGAQLGKMGKGFEINRNKKWYSGENLAKRAANLISGASGVRMNASMVGGALETGGKAAKKVAGSPQIKPQSIGDTMWKSIKTGFTGKKEEKEKKEKTYAELQKDHEKALAERNALRVSGMTDEEMKGVNDEIEKIEGSMAKEHERPETIGEYVDEIAAMNKKKGELLTKGFSEDDLAYYTDRITALEKGFDKATERDPEKMRLPELGRHIAALQDAIRIATENNMTALVQELEGMHTEASATLARRSAPPQVPPATPNPPQTPPAPPTPPQNPPAAPSAAPAANPGNPPQTPPATPNP